MLAPCNRLRLPLHTQCRCFQQHLSTAESSTEHQLKAAVIKRRQSRTSAREWLATPLRITTERAAAAAEAAAAAAAVDAGGSATTVAAAPAAPSAPPTLTAAEMAEAAQKASEAATAEAEKAVREATNNAAAATEALGAAAESAADDVPEPQPKLSSLRQQPRLNRAASANGQPAWDLMGPNWDLMGPN